MVIIPTQLASNMFILSATLPPSTGVPACAQSPQRSNPMDIPHLQARPPACRTEFGQVKSTRGVCQTAVGGVGRPVSADNAGGGRGESVGGSAEEKEEEGEGGLGSG